MPTPWLDARFRLAMCRLRRFASSAMRTSADRSGACRTVSLYNPVVVEEEEEEEEDDDDDESQTCTASTVLRGK